MKSVIVYLIIALASSSCMKYESSYVQPPKNQVANVEVEQGTVATKNPATGESSDGGPTPPVSVTTPVDKEIASMIETLPEIPEMKCMLPTNGQEIL